MLQYFEEGVYTHTVATGRMTQHNVRGELQRQQLAALRSKVSSLSCANTNLLKRSGTGGNVSAGHLRHNHVQSRVGVRNRVGVTVRAKQALKTNFNKKTHAGSIFLLHKQKKRY